MASSSSCYDYYFPIIFLTIFASLTPPSKSTSILDYTTLVYKGCAKQPLPNPTDLSTLFTSLTQQSSRTKYYKASSSNGPQGPILGLFQCRGDLNNADCYTCINKIPSLMTQLCGNVVSARVQLLGCYISYEISGFTQVSGLQLLYKVCSPTDVSGSGFEIRRDTALSVMQNGLGSGNGFYTTDYQSVYVLGQCEGDLGVSDCGLCVKSAIQKAQVECGTSLSAQVYLHKCFITYSYYPNGVPTKSSSFSSPAYHSQGKIQDTGKSVAIILGVTAGVGFVIICVLFVRGLRKKDDDF